MHRTWDDIGRAWSLVAVVLATPPAFAQQSATPSASDSTLGLAKQTQNPVADPIGLPLQRMREVVDVG